MGGPHNVTQVLPPESPGLLSVEPLLTRTVHGATAVSLVHAAEAPVEASLRREPLSCPTA